MLHTVRAGSGRRGPNAPAGDARVVLVHGFTQTHHSWDEVAAALADRFEVVMVELPGHGGSASARLDFPATAAAIADAGGGPATYVGYSMGGRLCLRTALDTPPGVVTSLVLVGASPGIEDPSTRAERRRADALLADDLAAGDTKAFLDGWLAQPLFETTTPRPTDLEARRANPPDGLAYALRKLGTGTQDPLWDRLPELSMPVLLVAGERDAKFRALAERMAEAIGPNARTAWVPGAGHAVPLDQPSACADLIERFASSSATR
ncbi:MAG TPA: alpha/beta fold hydrolase [Acidimicrobiales bacterium]